MVRASVLVAPSVIAILSILALPVTASGCHLVQDDLLVPWTVEAPPGALREELATAEAVMLVYEATPGGDYAFYPNSASKQCEVDVCLELPSVAASWYTADDVLLETAGSWGGVEGVVPDGAAYGLVYFRTAPNVFSIPLGVPLHMYGVLCA